jgi:hypothetical protein
VVMREIAGALLSLLLAAFSAHASITTCDTGAAKYTPCELRFTWNEGDASQSGAHSQSPFRDELVRVEFRGPDNATYLIRAFWDGNRDLRARFTPDQSGIWTYRITSSIQRLDNKQATFNVSDTQSPGYIHVANLRHWWTDNKQPHLWAAAEVPWLDLDDAAFKAYVDDRKRDGFTHLRGVLLGHSSQLGDPLDAKLLPEFAYFRKLDERLLYAQGQGFVVDLILADSSFLQTGALDRPDERDDLIRYVISRYSPFDATWQGVEHFEDHSGSRALLKQISAMLDKYDAYRHPRSTDARISSSMLLQDGWEKFIMEASPNPQLGAVEHQITSAPQIHVIQNLDTDAFRHELWQSTTNGEYPTMPYKASTNPANLQAMRVWVKVMSDVRHWEFEPFFDVDGARAVGLDNVEYLLYAQQPGTVEISFSEKHKYNPLWINPRSGETIDLKDVKQDTYSQTTPEGGGDWILQLPRNGQKEGMLKSYKFESVPAPIQEVETNAARVPFEIRQPSGKAIDTTKPVNYEVHIKRPNRATRSMQYVWTGEVIAEGEGPRVLALGSSGTFEFPRNLVKAHSAMLTVRLNAINANGKAYLFEKVYQISQ